MKKSAIFVIVLFSLMVGVSAFAATEIISDWGVFYDNLTVGNGSNTIIFYGDEGNISALGNVSADFYVGDGSLLTGISSYTHPEQMELNSTSGTTGDYPLILNQDFTVSSGFSNTHLSTLDINNDLTISGSSFVFNTMSGADIAVDVTHSGFTGTQGIVADGIRVQVAMDDTILPGLQSDANGLDVAISRSSSNSVYGAYTKANQAGTGASYGYQGYGSNSGAGTTLNAVGVYGFAASTNGLEAGILASSFGTGNSDFAYYGGQGHFWMKGGNMYLRSSASLATVTDMGNITQGEDGSLYVENNVQIDGNLYVGGNMNISGCINYNGGTLGVCI